MIRHSSVTFGPVILFCLWYSPDIWNLGAPDRTTGLKLKEDQARCCVWWLCDCERDWACVCRGLVMSVRAHWPLKNTTPPPLNCRRSQQGVTLCLKVLRFWNQKILFRTSLAVQWLRLCASTAGGAGLIPARGTKISHAAQRDQKKRKENAMSWLTP